MHRQSRAVGRLVLLRNLALRLDPAREAPRVAGQRSGRRLMMAPDVPQARMRSGAPLAGAQPGVSASLRSWRAMISRWISEVPS
jgi:hypothetical protein